MSRDGTEYYTDEDVAGAYDEKRFGGQGGAYIRRVERDAYRSMLGDVEGKRVLDVATGTGRLAMDLADRGADVTAVDLSQQMLDRAADKATEEGRDITFRQADATDLPFDDGSFDVVTAQRFLHLLDDQRPVVAELARVADDRIAYDYFNTESLRQLYTWALPMDSHLHRPSVVRDMLKELDLVDIQEDRRLFLPYGLFRDRSGPHVSALVRLDQWLTRRPLLRRDSSVVYVTARVP